MIDRHGTPAGEAGPTSRAHPPVAAERQWRALDAAPQPSLLQVAVKRQQAVEVDRAVKNPGALQQAGGSGGLFTQEHSLVGQIDHIVDVGIGVSAHF